MDNILFIDACARENSRTRVLAKYLLGKFEGNVTTLNLYRLNLSPVDGDTVNRRDIALQNGDFDDPLFDLSKQFAAADIIVIAAPYWDMSFPSILKEYIENICVNGITFHYGTAGAVGDCKGRDLYYVTTAGGYIINKDYGYGYISDLSKNMLGVNRTHYIAAENLDMPGADVSAILSKAKMDMDLRF